MKSKRQRTSVLLPCAFCGRGYPQASVGKELFISTGICVYCYLEAEAAPSSEWCFGKPELYDATAPDCRACPDRNICRLFISLRAVRGRVKPGF